MSKIFAIALALTVFFTSSALAQSSHPVTGEPLVLTCYLGTPTLDGNLDEWQGLDAAVVDAESQVFTGIENWTDASDCSAKFYVMWDNTNIYIAIDAKDDTVVNTATDGDIWRNDAAEVFFSTTNAIVGHDEHYQYGFTPDEMKWNWCNIDGAGSVDPDCATSASTVTGDGYIIEAAIEYGEMASLNFATNSVIGFHPALDDADGDGSARDLQITWTGLEAHDQSTGFGHLILSSDVASAVSADGKLATKWSQIKAY
ncbi:sugar-binding protein [Candidatus Poribacteria bacterium]